LTDRREIKILLTKRYSLRDIAKALSKSVSTISDELTRNSKKDGSYDPDYANHLAYVRRRKASFKGKKIVKYNELRQFVEQGLTDGKSPDSIAGRLKNHEPHLPYASKDTIYKYQQSPYGKLLGLKKPKKKRKHGYKSKKKLKDRDFIEKRPLEANLRKSVGHAEGDFIVSGRNGKGILLVVVDRKCRIAFLEIMHKVTIKNVEKSFLAIKKRFPEMKTLTVDNDILLRHHQRLERLLKVKVYFCNPYHSWEKGTVENTNKYIRRYIPKGSDLSKYSKNEIKLIQKVLNDRYLKLLNYQTPLEVLKQYRKNKKQQR
jgi:transposase, IS30 family